MDKKFYFAPEMDELELEVASMLCASNGLDDPDEDTGEAPKSDIVI